MKIIKKQPKKIVSVRLNVEIIKRIKKLAKQNDATVTQILEAILNEYCEK